MSKHSYNIHTLKEQVHMLTRQYLEDIGDCNDANIYHKIVSNVEESILEALIDFTKGNQKEAAILSGISRNTMRKKLEKHNIKY